MSDNVIIMAILCIFIFGTVCVICMTTYMKDKIMYEVRTRYKDKHRDINNEVCVTALDENTKK